MGGRRNDSENTGEILRAHEGCTYLYVDRGTYPTARGHSPKARSARSHISAFFGTHAHPSSQGIVFGLLLCDSWRRLTTLSGQSVGNHQYIIMSALETDDTVW